MVLHAEPASPSPDSTPAPALAPAPAPSSDGGQEEEEKELDGLTYIHVYIQIICLIILTPSYTYVNRYVHRYVHRYVPWSEASAPSGHRAGVRALFGPPHLCLRRVVWLPRGGEGSGPTGRARRRRVWRQ